MRRENLSFMLEGIRKLLPKAALTINRWLNTFEVVVLDVDMRVPQVYTFKDNPIKSTDCPTGRMVDLLYSLPIEQRLPWLPFISDLLERDIVNAKATLKLNTMVDDVSLELTALRHDLEASKRERDYYKAKAGQ